MNKFCQLIAYSIIILCIQIFAQETKLLNNKEFIIDGWDFNSEINKDKYSSDNLIEIENNDNLIFSKNTNSMWLSEFVDKYEFIGVSIGYEIINSEYFLRVNPKLNLKLSKFSFGLGSPIRFSLYDASNQNGLITSFFNGFSRKSKFLLPRSVDWSNASNFMCLLRYLTYGKLEDNIYIDFNRIKTITIGHGQLMRCFVPNINIDQNNIYSTFRLKFKDFNLHAFVGPFLLPNQFGFNIFTKPFFKNIDSKLLSSIELGINYVGDINAPISLKRDGDLIALNSYKKFASNNASVHGLGILLSAKILQFEFFQINFYSDYSHLLFPHIEDIALNINSNSFSGGSFSFGFLTNLGLGEANYNSDGKAINVLHNLKAKFETRLFGGQYFPSYFNTLYSVQKYQFGFGTELDRKLRPTKIGYLALQKNQFSKIGYYLEASYFLHGWFGINIVYEDAIDLLLYKIDTIYRNFSFHIESSEISFFQFLATYQIMGFPQMSKIFKFNRGNELFFFIGKFKLSPFIYINTWMQRSFRSSARVNGDEYPRALPSDFNNEKYIFSNIGLDNAWSLGFNLEVALQF